MKIMELVDLVLDDMEEGASIEFDLGVSVNKKKEVEVDPYSQNKIKFTGIRKKK